MWLSDELENLLAGLSAQQARGVVRIVQAELAGESLTSLLTSPDKICTYKTYHGSGNSKGWKHKPAFRQALEVARRDYRAWLMENGTTEALTVLAVTAPEAAKVLRQRVLGEGGALAVLEACLGDPDPAMRAAAAVRLGQTGLPQIVAALRGALGRESEAVVRMAIVEALGMVAGGSGRDIDAADDVLDRAAVKTASKGLRAITGGEGGPLEVNTGPNWAGMDEGELDGVINNLLAATDIQSATGRGVVGESEPEE